MSNVLDLLMQAARLSNETHVPYSLVQNSKGEIEVIPRDKVKNGRILETVNPAMCECIRCGAWATNTRNQVCAPCRGDHEDII